MLWGKYRAWRERRKQSGLERWGRTRAKGKMRFVIGYSIVFAVTVIVLTSLADYYYDRKFSHLLLRTIIWSITALIFSLVLWSLSERRYNNAKRDARIKSSGA
jgi:lysylphosphatidylglycerol synthetase-like protein (DUF2156 family)